MSRPGLQPERTELAWRRTGIATTITALALARIAAGLEEPIAAVGAILAVLLGLSALVASYRRYPRLMRHLERGGSLRLPLMALLGVLGTVLTGLVGLILVLAR